MEEQIVFWVQNDEVGKRVVDAWTGLVTVMNGAEAALSSGARYKVDATLDDNAVLVQLNANLPDSRISCGDWLSMAFPKVADAERLYEDILSLAHRQMKDDLERQIKVHSLRQREHLREQERLRRRFYKRK